MTLTKQVFYRICSLGLTRKVVEGIKKIFSDSSQHTRLYSKIALKQGLAFHPLKLQDLQDMCRMFDMYLHSTATVSLCWCNLSRTLRHAKYFYDIILYYTNSVLLMNSLLHSIDVNTIDVNLRNAVTYNSMVTCNTLSPYFLLTTEPQISCYVYLFSY